MKAFVIACIAVVVIAVGGALVLEGVQRSAETAYSTTGVRI